MKVRELLTTWAFDVDMQSLDRMDNKIGQLRNNAKKFGQNMKAVTDGMINQGAKLSAFVTLPIIGIGAAMVKAASDAEETESKYATVFQNVAAESEVVASELAKNFGLASDTSKKLLGDTGDLLTGFGFTGKSALDLSKGVQELAVDLASFTNFAGGAEGASAALTKALLGERESVKALGISILEEDVKAKIASLEATGKLTNESDKQKKAIATLAIAVEQSKNAIGDYARTSGGFANQQKLLGQRIKSLGISFGKVLIPFALKAVKAVTRLTEKFTGLSTRTKEWIVIGFGVVAVLGPLLLFAGLAASAILALGSAFVLLKGIIIAVRTASLSTLLVWAAIPIAVGLIIAAAGLLLEDLWVLANGGDSAIGALLSSIDIFGMSAGEVFDDIVESIKGMINWVVEAGSTVTNALGGAFTKVNELASNTLKSIGGFFGIGDGDSPKVTPAQNIARAATLPTANAARPARTSTTKTNNVDIRPTINLSVPVGTPEDQQRVITESVELASKEIFDREVRKMINENPEVS